MTHHEIASLRLRNQWLSGPAQQVPETVVRRLVAVQSQDYYGARWAVGLRLQNSSDDVVERAFNEGRILRTHLLRPTWHFVTPLDIRWLLALTAPRVHALNRHMYHQLELDRMTLNRATSIVATSLEDGRQLTRGELRDVLEGEGITTDGQRMAYIMMFAELEAVVCSGPRRGKQFTYGLVEERAPTATILHREESLAELARRYFDSRGPATVHDFAKWSGLRVSDARTGLEMAKSRLSHEALEGREYWFSGAEPAGDSATPTAHLLSIYDEYISSYKNWSAIGSPRDADALKKLGNALNYIIVLDGRIVGTWKRAIRKDGVLIEMDMFRPLTDAQGRAVAEAAEEYGAFHGLPVIMNPKKGAAGAGVVDRV